METYKHNTHPELKTKESLRSYFGGWPVLALAQFKSSSEDEQHEVLCLLAKYKEVEAYTHFRPEAKYNGD